MKVDFREAVAISEITVVGVIVKQYVWEMGHVPEVISLVHMVYIYKRIQRFTVHICWENLSSTFLNGYSELGWKF